MIYIKSRRVCLIVIGVFGLACLAGSQSPRQTAMPDKTPPAATGLPPTVTLKSIFTGTLKEPLKFKWEIKNESAVPVYIYSTLFESLNAGLGEMHINKEQGTIELYFLYREPLRHSIYNFPRATFKLLNPGQAMAGTFISTKPAGQLDEYVLSDSRLDRIQLTPGYWKVRCAVAYGREIESVNAQLKTLYSQGTEHPINPVVRWQKVAYSNPLEIRLRQ
jgi:hypothetical protein